MSSAEPNPNQINVRAIFATTRWSMVLAAGQSSSGEAEQALDGLCRTYWYPLYAFVRRQGRNPEDAEDLTQGFFEHLLEKKALRAVIPGKGKFRSFLLASLKNFLANDWDRQHAIKRGGKHTFISLDDGSAEDRYLREPSHDVSPEKLYDRTWAQTIIHSVHQQLRKKYEAKGKAKLFEALQDHLLGEEDSTSYAKLGALLDMRGSAVRTTVYRMRKQFQALVHKEIAQTVSNVAEVEEERRHLAMSSKR